MLSWTTQMMNSFFRGAESSDDEGISQNQTPSKAETPDAIDIFLKFLDTKEKALQDMKQFWLDKRVSEAEILRAQSPFMASALETNPLPTAALLDAGSQKSIQDYTLPATEVDDIPIKATTRTWFESILTLLKNEILPANQVLEAIELSAQERIKPMLEKLREKEKKISEWNAAPDDDLARSALPILRQEICTYAIEMIESQISMLEAVRSEIKLCIGWENLTEALCDKMLVVLDASVAALVLPVIDFSSPYRTFLHSEITPDIADIEVFEAGIEGGLKQAQSALMFKNTIAAPKPTHVSQEPVLSLSS